jgi:hypothetical protein
VPLGVCGKHALHVAAQMNAGLRRLPFGNVSGFTVGGPASQKAMPVSGVAR